MHNIISLDFMSLQLQWCIEVDKWRGNLNPFCLPHNVSHTVHNTPSINAAIKYWLIHCLQATLFGKWQSLLKDALRWVWLIQIHTFTTHLVPCFRRFSRGLLDTVQKWIEMFSGSEHLLHSHYVTNVSIKSSLKNHANEVHMPVSWCTPHSDPPSSFIIIMRYGTGAELDIFALIQLECLAAFFSFIPNQLFVCKAPCLHLHAFASNTVLLVWCFKNKYDVVDLSQPAVLTTVLQRRG